MTTVSPKKGHDPARGNEISEKLMENPELASLISELSTSADDASELVKGLLQASINAGLQAEMDAHLGYSHSDRKTKAQVETAQESNHCNGSYTKTVNSGYGAVEVTVSRDRAGTFTPRMVPKGARRLTELDDMIVSLYAGGMTVRDIQHHLATTLGVDMSPDTISTITDAVLDEVMIWQNRQLDEFYPVIFLDALRVKIRDGHRVVNKACCMAVGVDMDGIKHILGLWIADNEGAAFWASVCADLANRGVQDVFIVCCDRLKGLPEAVEATWPNSMVQTCIVHLIRAANRWVSYQDRKSVSRALREVYTAASEDTARASLDAFEASELGLKYPQSVKVWRDAWGGSCRFCSFRGRHGGCSTPPTRSNRSTLKLRKATRNRSQFPNDTAALKTLWLMICNIEDKRAAQRANKAKRDVECNGYVEGAKATGWKQAINQLAVAYPDRFADYL